MSFQKRAGDWMCPNCDFLIFSSKSSCLKCGATKPGKNRSNEGGRRRYSRYDVEWRCDSCKTTNFPDRDKCRNCRTIRSDIKPSKPKALKNKNTDWICNNCKTSNFSDRDRCRKCNKYSEKEKRLIMNKNTNNNTQNDKCHRCGKSGHWARECDVSYSSNFNKKNDKCIRCGKHGHWARDCHEKILKRRLDDDDNSDNEPPTKRQKIDDNDKDKDKDNEIPDYFCDPISFEVMKQPTLVMVSGVTYEKSVIEQYVKENGKDPMTRQPVTIDQLAPNRALRDTIEAWKKKHPDVISDDDTT